MKKEEIERLCKIFDRIKNGKRIGIPHEGKPWFVQENHEYVAIRYDDYEFFQPFMRVRVKKRFEIGNVTFESEGFTQTNVIVSDGIAILDVSTLDLNDLETVVERACLSSRIKYSDYLRGDEYKITDWIEKTTDEATKRNKEKKR